MDTSNTQILDGSFSWIGIDNSIKYGAAELVLWAININFHHSWMKSVFTANDLNKFQHEFVNTNCLIFMKSKVHVCIIYKWFRKYNL